MEVFENKSLNENPIFSYEEINGYLKETSTWGKFLAFVGYVTVGIFVLLALFMMFGASQLSNYTQSPMPMPFGFLGFIYLVLAGLYLIPINYLHKFAIRMKGGILQQDKAMVISGFENLKSLFKFMGVFTIVLLSMYALILIVAVPMAIFLAP
ncbi:MAG: hypothetical protein Q8O72_13390 [Bacteroidales bacterium]|nr:hypothetical protein [Bacteroidales bacterium]